MFYQNSWKLVLLHEKEMNTKNESFLASNVFSTKKTMFLWLKHVTGWKKTCVIFVLTKKKHVIVFFAIGTKCVHLFNRGKHISTHVARCQCPSHWPQATPADLGLLVTCCRGHLCKQIMDKVWQINSRWPHSHSQTFRLNYFRYHLT